MNVHRIKFNNGREDVTIEADCFVPNSGIIYFKRDGEYVAMYKQEVVEEIELVD